MLPLLNFAPWTGWLAFEEFDLLVLGALAAGYARLAWQASEARPGASDSAGPWPRCSAVRILVVAFGGLGLIGLCRGIDDAGGWTFGWFDGYAQALNSLRVGKSLLYALALWPLLQDELQPAAPRAFRRLALGMQVGLAFVGLAVLWERAAYPGLLDFSSRYRTTALFWEMHVGGAAIDAYLVLATPFAAWALWTARTRRAWAAAAVLALLTGYACLTTFSRGVYAGVSLPLLGLGIAWWMRRRTLNARDAWLALAQGFAAAAVAATLLSVAFATWGYPGIGMALAALVTLLLALRLRWRALGWRKVAAMTLTAALMTEAIAVIGGGSFLRTRLLESERDFGSRLAHWKRGMGLLQGPADWLLGLGLGRLPSSYASLVPGGEFSGALKLTAAETGGHTLKISGPARDEDLGGLYALTQRVALRSGGPHRVSLTLRVEVATDLYLSVCERHLLYPRQCQGALVRVLPRGGAFQHISFALHGPWLAPGHWYAPRLGVFSLSVAGAGAAAQLASVSLSAPDGTELLANRDFATGLAHWFPTAQSYFLPWHIDNLALEVLIERGGAGLAVFVALIGCAVRRLASAAGVESRFTPVLAASLCGALLVGLVGSLMDVPRIAFLLLLLVFFSLQLGARKSASAQPLT